jgi:predicted RNase H-like HicB family nuclease
MKELVFKVYQEEDGGYVAKTKLENGTITTQGDDLSELKIMLADAINGYFFEKPAEKPTSVRLHFMKINEESFALA